MMLHSNVSALNRGEPRLLPTNECWPRFVCNGSAMQSGTSASNVRLKPNGDKRNLSGAADSMGG